MKALLAMALGDLERERHARGSVSVRASESVQARFPPRVLLGMFIALMTSLLSAAEGAEPQPTAADDVVYAPPSSCAALPSNCLPGQCKEQRAERTACLATEARLLRNRTLTSVLADLPTVLDFGARANPSVDDTQAFTFGLAAHPTLRVPAGTYRIDGTIALPQQRELILDAGAELLRYNSTLDGAVVTDPIVRFYSHSAALSGSGSLVSQVALCLSVSLSLRV